MEGRRIGRGRDVGPQQYRVQQRQREPRQVADQPRQVQVHVQTVAREGLQLAPDGRQKGTC